MINKNIHIIKSDGKTIEKEIPDGSFEINVGDASKVIFDISTRDVAKYENIDGSLVMTLADGNTISLIDFFRDDEDGRPELLLQTEYNGIAYTVALSFGAAAIGELVATETVGAAVAAGTASGAAEAVAATAAADAATGAAGASVLTGAGIAGAAGAVAIGVAQDDSQPPANLEPGEEKKEAESAGSPPPKESPKPLPGKETEEPKSTGDPAPKEEPAQQESVTPKKPFVDPSDGTVFSGHSDATRIEVDTGDELLSVPVTDDGSWEARPKEPVKPGKEVKIAAINEEGDVSKIEQITVGEAKAGESPQAEPDDKQDASDESSATETSSRPDSSETPDAKRPTEETDGKDSNGASNAKPSTGTANGEGKPEDRRTEKKEAVQNGDASEGQNEASGSRTGDNGNHPGTEKKASAKDDLADYAGLNAADKDGGVPSTAEASAQSGDSDRASNAVKPGEAGAAGGERGVEVELMPTAPSEPAEVMKRTTDENEAGSESAEASAQYLPVRDGIVLQIEPTETHVSGGPALVENASGSGLVKNASGSDVALEGGQVATGDGTSANGAPEAELPAAIDGPQVEPVATDRPETGGELRPAEPTIAEQTANYVAGRTDEPYGEMELRDATAETLLARTMADSTGAWTMPIPENAGSRFSLVALDDEGNRSEPLPFQVAPPPPDSLRMENDTGIKSNDYVTKAEEVVFVLRGTAKGNLIEIQDKDGNPVARSEVGDDLLARIPVKLEEGPFEYRAVQIQDGNTSELSEPIVGERDTTKPNMPTVEETDGTVIQGTVSGAKAGDFVRLRDKTSGEDLGTAIVQADGSWQLAAEPPVDDGHVVEALTESLAGVRSDPVTVTVVSVAPPPPALQDYERDTGRFDDDDATYDKALTFTGRGEPGNAVIIMRDGEEVGRGTVDANGNFRITVKPVERDGTYGYTAIQEKNGNTSDVSDKITVRHDATPPKAPIPEKLTSSEITGRAADSDTRFVNAYNQTTGKFIGTAEVVNGRFAIKLDAGTNGGDRILLEAEDLVGNRSGTVSTEIERSSRGGTLSWVSFYGDPVDVYTFNEDGTVKTSSVETSGLRGNVIGENLWESSALADMTGDGVPDLIHAREGGHLVDIFPGIAGTLQFEQTAIRTTGFSHRLGDFVGKTNYEFTAFADVLGDSYKELFHISQNRVFGKRLAIFEGRKNGWNTNAVVDIDNFYSGMDYAGTGLNRFSGLADFDGDGDLDYGFGREGLLQKNNYMLVFFNDGNGNFSPPAITRFDRRSNKNAIGEGKNEFTAFGEYTQDGYADLLHAVYHPFKRIVEITVTPGLGDGRFDFNDQRKSTVHMGKGTLGADYTRYTNAQHDINGDGLLDIVTGDDQGPREINVIMQRGNGYFESTPVKTSGMPGHKEGGRWEPWSGTDGNHAIFIGRIGGNGEGKEEMRTVNGTGRADTLTGTGQAERILGKGGADDIRAGGGDDLIIVSDDSFTNIDGGDGYDTLALAGGGIDLDLTGRNDVRSIEALDIAGNGDNAVRLDAQTARGLSEQTDDLFILADHGDTVYAEGFTRGADHAVGDKTYHSFHADGATLYIDSLATVVLT